MSITFFSPQAPDVLKNSYPCQCTYANETPSAKCYYCAGTGVHKFYGKENEINLSNTNAVMMMRHLGLRNLGVVMKAEEVPVVLRRIMRLLNTEVPGDEAVAPTAQVGAKGATLIDAGREAGYVTERLRWFQDLFKEAADNGWEVTWG